LTKIRIADIITVEVMKEVIHVSIRQIRRFKGLTQVEVARLIGISQSGYSQIERGEINPKVQTAKRIARILETDWEGFYEGQGDGEDAESHIDESGARQGGVEGMGEPVSGESAIPSGIAGHDAGGFRGKAGGASHDDAAIHKGADADTGESVAGADG
jgi:transcriptional regulator with XRE-family HTH domain